MKMASDLDFYFDFTSPYGYFAAMRIDALAAKYRRAVKWHPILLGVVFKRSGMAPLTTIPMKGGYSLRDFARTARFHGIPYQQPAAFPIATQAAARATLWLQNTVGDAEAIAFAKAVYQAYFADGVDIGEPANLLRIASGLGVDGAALMEGISGPAIKDQLKNEIEQAMLRDVFGSPFIIVDGEPFWGFDRFDQLEAFLKNGTILD
jgi:2-hydroxychromene-2-carboxylate isomerase